MARPPTLLLGFLKPFPPEVRKTALALRAFVWGLYPQTNELIYDNYNAVAIGWSITDRVSHVFCNIAVGRSSHTIQFGFYWGSKIRDPEKLLIGSGSQYRYYRVADLEKFPKAYLTKLMKAAHAYSMSLVKDKTQIRQGETIVKSVSDKKRPVKKSLRNPAGKRKARNR